MIREACAEDIPAIARIYAHWVLNGVSSFETEPPDEVEMRARFEKVREAGLPYLVNCEDGIVNGYAYATLYRPRRAYRFTVENSIYLDPSSQGRGIGRALLEQLMSRCAALGYRQMVAVVGGGLENAASIRLHERCGFTRSGLLREVGYKFDRWLDTALLQCDLKACGSPRSACETSTVSD